jgi:hypothetical protein
LVSTFESPDDRRKTHPSALKLLTKTFRSLSGRRTDEAERGANALVGFDLTIDATVQANHYIVAEMVKAPGGSVRISLYRST